MKETILVVAAHPDDEILGCGGTIAKHSDNGDSVHVLIVAEGATARLNNSSKDEFEHYLIELKISAEKASSLLGVKSLEMLSLPDNRLDSIDRLDIIKKIEHYVDLYSPSTVYSHHVGDVNIDHRIIHEAVVTACRPMPGQSVKRLLSFEVQSSTEWQPPNSAPQFAPNWYVDINKQLCRKIEALNFYSGEMRDWPHSRSVRSSEYLARLRGSQVGIPAAECFSLLRNIC